MYSSRTPRTSRTIPEIYIDLNQPIRSKTRTPVEPAAAYPSPRPRILSSRTTTDTSTFRSVDDRTQRLETIIASSRREKSQQLQQWIEEFKPTPIEVLRKIAAVSDPHRSVLTLIADELSRFPPNALIDPLDEMNCDAMDEIANIKIKSHDLQRHMRELETEEKDLKRKLQEALDKQEKARQEYERYKKLIEVSTFNSHKEDIEEEQRCNEERIMKQNQANSEESVRYNQLWGENKHLRNETAKIQGKIDEQRKYHQEFTTRRAMEIFDSRQIQEVEPILENEFISASSL